MLEGLYPEADWGVVVKGERVSSVSSLGSKQTTWSVLFFFDAVNYLRFYYTKILN